MSPAPAAPAERATSADRARRREALLDAADTVVRRLGPDASMAAIAAEAGVTKPILYRHFADRADLLQALVQRHGDALLGQLRAALHRARSRRGRTEAVIDTYLRFLAADPDLYRYLVRRVAAEDPSVRGQVVSLADRFAAELAGAVTAELGWTDRQADQAAAWAHGMVGMVQATADWWLDRQAAGRGPSRATVARQLTDLLWGAFGQA